MFFRVQEKGEPFPGLEGEEFVLLRRDNWDDWGFKTTFNVEVYLKDGRVVDLGPVKVLAKGQKSGYTPAPPLFEQLDHNYCSLGQSLSYYETLHALGSAITRRVLRGLRDVVFQPSIRQEFIEEEGFEVSLERFGSSARAIEDAAPLFRNSFQLPSPKESPPLRLSFLSSVGGSNFTANFAFNEVKEIPSRINAIIGYNGTGKTRLLANLAWVAQADVQEREQHKFAMGYGRFITPQKLRFGSVLAISYSAFDTFEVPGRNALERERIARSGDLWGYVYCGLRKFSNEQERQTDRPLSGSDAHTLKSISEISSDFLDALRRTEDEPRRSLLDAALESIEEEPSFGRLGVSPRLLHEETFRSQIFPALSTGHKIVLNIVVHLAAHLERRSLVLIDEPESHLHPPLLAALIKSINLLLERRDSYAVIATHSPVVLQEVPRRYVRVLRRNGQHTYVHEPEIETFGENVGTLTRHVFDLDSSSTDYHEILGRLSKSHTIQEIDAMFGGEGMSAQARAYVRGVQRSRELD
ncbi:AAA family ATPase [Micromonospora haikouensis]|uniref:AAA family ATPase n=1 Tax=Micromonospora haikouensis TaxID=686309 RepID=UPI0037A27149